MDLKKKDALIIFIRNPVLGKVKTRLAKDLGPQMALSVYQVLLQHSRDITRDLFADRFLYYADQISVEDGWPLKWYNKRLQVGHDLGERMLLAFEEVFRESYEKVVIMGSDCFELQQEHLIQAFESLSRKNVVLGPARDGGYYLLGMNSFYPELFKSIAWGTERVLEQTRSHLNHLGLTCQLLTPLRDIDRSADITPELLRLTGFFNSSESSGNGAVLENSPEV
ncbi:MAG: TIGR04282 family arsenosugar biosynthesis glycosyltransferase [Chitinophagaceae bacterium]